MAHPLFKILETLEILEVLDYLGGGLDLEEGEVHLAVGAVLHEVGQVAEVVGARVLDDKQRARVHQRAVHYQLG